MKTTSFLRTGILASVLTFSSIVHVYAQAGRNQGMAARNRILSSSRSAIRAETSPAQREREIGTRTEQSVPETSQKTGISRPRISSAKTVDFHLRTGAFVYGRLVSEDKNKVIVEQLNESKIISSTYSRREIEPRTLNIRNVPEYKYYLDLAEYFSSRTWDFRDDPDDFIQAIRCCERAKQSLLASQSQDSDKIEQIEEKMRQLQENRQVWEKEVKSRAELKKLEFEAEAEKRLKELEDKMNASGQQVDKSIQELQKTIQEINNSQQNVEQVISGMSQDISQRLGLLADRIEANRRLIDPWRWQPGYFYQYPYRGRVRPYEQP